MTVQKKKKKGQKTVEDKSSKDSWKRKNEKEERIKKLQKKLDQIEEQITNSQKHLKNLEVKLSSIDVTKQEEYENISKEYADTTLRVNQLTKESEILIEEIISLE